jgi:t-SNARE complex subunit (syntaxin)
LHLAYQALIEDGGYPDLKKAVENKLKELDSVFRRKIDNEKPTFEEQRALSEDISNFVSEMQKTDRKLKSEIQQDSKSIFGDENHNAEPERNEFAEEL